MGDLRATRTTTAVAGMALVAAVAFAGCGGSSSSAKVPATKQISANWAAFFSARTPTAQRITLLQDGSAFSAVIRAQAGSALAKQASAKVLDVHTTSATAATVTYDILLSGSPVLKSQKGTAVLQHGTWQVGTASFCALLRLEGAAPPACTSAAG